jgi:hypothetical protein
MAYLAKILAWKTGQYILEKVLWGGNIVDILGGKVGFGPIVGLLTMMAAALMDYINNKDEEGYSFSDYTLDKLSTEQKATLISMIGLPGGLITQIEQGIEAQKEGGVFSPTGRLKFPNEVSDVQTVMAMMFGIFSTPTAQWSRTRDVTDTMAFLGLGQTELPLGEEDTNYYKRAVERGASKEELRSLYIKLLNHRAKRSYDSQMSDITKRIVKGEITPEQGRKQRENAKELLRVEIAKLEKIDKEGFKVLPF